MLRETGCEPSNALLALGRRIEADAAKVRPAPTGDVVCPRALARGQPHRPCRGVDCSRESLEGRREGHAQNRPGRGRGRHRQVPPGGRLPPDRRGGRRDRAPGAGIRRHYRRAVRPDRGRSAKRSRRSRPGFDCPRMADRSGEASARSSAAFSRTRGARAHCRSRRCLAAVRGRCPGGGLPRRRATPGDLGGRSPVVRRGQLQADPVPRPPAGARGDSLAGHDHAGRAGARRRPLPGSAGPSGRRRVRRRSR